MCLVGSAGKKTLWTLVNRTTEDLSLYREQYYMLILCYKLKLINFNCGYNFHINLQYEFFNLCFTIVKRCNNLILSKYKYRIIKYYKVPILHKRYHCNINN